MTGSRQLRALVVATVVVSAGFVAVGSHWAGRQSAAFDEPPMIVAGVRYRHGDLRWNVEHPPLVKWLAALALPEREPPLPPPEGVDPRRAQWGYGNEWLHGARQSSLALLHAARMPCVVLGALLLPLLVWGAFLLGGSRAAWAGLGLAATTPLWFAYSTLVNNDLAPALFLFASSLCAYRLVRAEGRACFPWAGAVTVALGLALASKHTAIGMPLLVLVGGVLDAWLLGRARLVAPPLLVTACFGAHLLAALFAWGLPPDALWHYLGGLHSVGFNHAVGYTYFAYGAPFSGRSYPYFAYALLVKTPWPVWVLGLALPFTAWLARSEGGSGGTRPGVALPALMVFVLPPLGYLAGVSLFAPPIGVRYALPVLPYVLLAAALGAAALSRLHGLRWWLLPLGVLQLWGLTHALNSGALGWFNGWPCSTGQLRACLDDSNVDWGQALPQLRAYRDRQAPNAALRVFYFGSAPLEAYLPNAEPADSREALRPRRDLYAVSLHFLVRMPPKSWAHQLQPVAVVAGAYAIYDLRER